MSSDLTTGRLSVYLRCLTFLEQAGQETVSSQDLAERFHLNSAQIRKDLACFGEQPISTAATWSAIVLLIALPIVRSSVAI